MEIRIETLFFSHSFCTGDGTENMPDRSPLEMFTDNDKPKNENPTMKKTYKILYFIKRSKNKHNLFLDNDHHHSVIIIVVVFTLYSHLTKSTTSFK